MKRRLFNIAWAIAKQFNSFGEALAMAWRIVKLQVELCLGVVLFKYKKVDGSIREAKGTLDGVPPVKGTDKAKNWGNICYFDIEANGWRSFKAENLIF